MAKEHNVWMSVSDLMTGLMIIFLFIAIAYMSKVDENQQVLKEYVETKRELHDKLVNEFAGDTTRWKMVVGKDLTMKFNNPEVLFASGSTAITDEFQTILDDFLPRYFDILLKDTLRDRIQEVRIEGHTDDSPMIKVGYDSDPYLGNIQLSQQRSYNVVKYFKSSNYYKNCSDSDKKVLEFWLSANGLSYGRSLDSNGEYTLKSHMQVDRMRSRRVEFRIVTSGEEVLVNFVKQTEASKINIFK